MRFEKSNLHSEDLKKSNLHSEDLKKSNLHTEDKFCFKKGSKSFKNKRLKGFEKSYIHSNGGSVTKDKSESKSRIKFGLWEERFYVKETF